MPNDTPPPGASLSDQDIAAMFAAQTAVVASLVRELAKAGSLDKTNFVNNVYDLLHEHQATRQNPRGAAPIKHLLDLLENR